MSKLNTENEIEINVDDNENNNTNVVDSDEFKEQILTNIQQQQQQIIPQQTMPSDTIPSNMIIQNTIPSNMIPQNMIPSNMIPQNMIPQIIPQNTIPSNMIPQTIPQNMISQNIPSDMIQQIISQQNMIPQTIPLDMIQQNKLPFEFPQSNFTSKDNNKYMDEYEKRYKSHIDNLKKYENKYMEKYKKISDDKNDILNRNTVEPVKSVNNPTINKENNTSEINNYDDKLKMTKKLMIFQGHVMNTSSFIYMRKIFNPKSKSFHLYFCFKYADCGPVDIQFNSREECDNAFDFYKNKMVEIFK
jgi:hypothetical protein